jgi:cation transport regulator ChaC
VAEVTEYMNIREINGYTIQYTPFHSSDGSSGSSSSSSANAEDSQPVVATTPPKQEKKRPQDMTATYQDVHLAAPSTQAAAAAPVPSPIKCLVYIGLPTNPQFMGPQDPQRLAEHIVASKGPSGENREYLYGLEKALDELSPESGDDHVSDLARRCREVEARGKGGGGGRS